ncbi:MAG: CRTAC1 family protein [Myxococcota bacterium]|nr:CRTAC1 family protein [Myxococcota bacterium]
MTTRLLAIAAWTLVLPSCNGGGGASDAGDVAQDVADDATPPEDADVVGDGDADANDAEPEAPPRICRPAATVPTRNGFANVTAEVGLDAANLHVIGNRIVSGDLDGDGYADLIVHAVYGNERDDPTASPPVYRKRVLLNRPGPGGGRVFAEWTVESGYGRIRDVEGLGRVAHLAALADVDNDGDLDIFSGTFVNPSGTPADTGDRSEILLNDGSAVFSLAPRSAVSPGPTQRWSTAAASFVDYDRDGNVDLFVGFWYRVYGYLEGLQDRLYRGAGDGAFADVTAAAGLGTTSSGYDEGTNHRPTYGVTACDVDSDGDPDLLVSAYGRQWNMLWENLGDGTFRDIAPQVGFHADDLDDYTDNEFYRCHCLLTGLCTAPAPRISCTEDRWNPGFDDQPWRAGGNTFSTACADADNDGDMDLFNSEIRHWWAGSSSDASELLENVPDSGERGWTFRRPGNSTNGLARRWRTVDWNEGDLLVAFVDFDNDGLKDVYLAASDYPDQRGFLFHRQPDGTYREIAREQYVSHPGAAGMTWADFDRDGDLDLVVGSSTMRDCCGWTENEVHYYRNDVGHHGNWVQVSLEGSGPPGANRSAVGARVTVTAGDLVGVQEVGGGYGHMTMQHDLVLHFGLGAACDVDSIEVRWPDAAGTVETFPDVRANYRVRIVQGSGRVRYELP